MPELLRQKSLQSAAAANRFFVWTVAAAVAVIAVAGLVMLSMSWTR
jgi:hypothetical protein